MSWKFAGIIFKKNYNAAYPELLKQLGVKYNQSAAGFTFADAVNRENRATALGQVHGNTLLLHHFLPYDCSYEPGSEGLLDELLLPLSLDGNIMNYIVDGVSGTYCFSLFSAGKRIRRWAAEPGKVWCDEGEPAPSETFSVLKNDSPIDIFSMNEDESRLFAVWEAFAGISFQELAQDDTPLFHFFL